MIVEARTGAAHVCAAVPGRSSNRSAMRKARRRLEVSVQDEGVEVGAVWPYDRAQLVIDSHLSKEVGVGKRLEYGAAQLSCEVDVS